MTARARELPAHPQRLPKYRPPDPSRPTASWAWATSQRLARRYRHVTVTEHGDTVRIDAHD